MTDFDNKNPSQSAVQTALPEGEPRVGAEKAERVLVVTTKRLLRHYQDKCEKLGRKAKKLG